MAQPDRHGGPGSDGTGNEKYYRCYNQTTKLATLFKEINEPADLAKLLDWGITDIWLPIPSEILPPDLGPGATSRLQNGQLTQLEDHFNVTEGVHCNISARALDSKRKIPSSLVFQKPLGHNQRTQAYVAAVKRVSNAGGVYALKLIRRKNTTFLDAQEQMRYIQSELGVLRKINHLHCVQLVASYTEHASIGILMHPVADHNLEHYLDEFDQKSGDRDELAGFFGCLASTLAALHYKFNIRHKDIKPQNILVKGGNVLFTDFGIALDWSITSHTTTQQETMRSPKYCAPEAASATESRNAQTDIWSLGCVFLEMVTVLKGLPRSAVEDALQKQPFHRSKKGIDLLMAELRKKQKCANTPLDWISEMLQTDKKYRPQSKKLKEMILKTETPGRLVFCGMCCIYGEDPPNTGLINKSKQGEVVDPPTEHDEPDQYPDGSTTSGSRADHDTTESGRWTPRTSGKSSAEGTINSLPITELPSPPISPSPPVTAMLSALSLAPEPEPEPQPPPRCFLSVFEHGAQDAPGRKAWHEIEVTQYPRTTKCWITPAMARKLRFPDMEKHKPCELVYRGVKFRSKQTVRVHWKAQGDGSLGRCKRHQFLVAEEATQKWPFKLLIGAEFLDSFGSDVFSKRPRDGSSQ